MIAVCSVIMLLRRGSIERLIQSEFTDYYEDKETFPCFLHRESRVDLEETAGQGEPMEIVRKDIGSFEASWDKYLQLPEINTERYICVKGKMGDFKYKPRGGYFDVGFIDDGTNMTGEHFKVLTGDGFNSGKEYPENHYPCLVTRYTLEAYDLALGEEVTFNDVGDENLSIVFHIEGVIDDGKYDDYFWHKSINKLNLVLFVQEDTINKFAKANNSKYVYYDTFRLYDYRKIDSTNAEQIESYLKQFKSRDGELSEPVTGLLTAALRKCVSVKAVLYAISVPLLMLVIIFIGMIAVRIIDSEQGEIAMLHSRGVTRGKIILIYTVQSFLIALASVAPGLFLGYLTGKITASTTGFLEFSTTVTRGYNMNIEMIIISFIAAGVSALIMLFPVIPRSKNTVVENKSKRHLSGTPFWEKYFIDIILLGISIYLLYGYYKQQDSLRLTVVSGSGIDPMIFLDSTLFLISCGLLILRMVSYLERFIFKVGQNKFSPAVYASFTQIIRTRRGAGTISVFLVLTIAMSIFDANMARTINANQEARISYNVGTDVVVDERWEIRQLSQESPIKWKAYEPDFGIYSDLLKDGMAESVARVQIDNNAKIYLNNKESEIGVVIGVDTKEMGLTGKLQDGLNDKHWYHYLNDLSQNTKGVIISDNLAKKYNLKVGDKITYARYSPVEPDLESAQATGTITGIMTAFPAYEAYNYYYNDQNKLVEQEKFLIVANLSTVINVFDKRPYKVWVKTDHTADEIESYLKEKTANTPRTFRSITSIKEKVDEMKSESLIKITNGLFTLDFLIALLLCVIGYLIHWITSIRDRELMFGIYRAMGISMGEINKMLSLEQMFMSLSPVLAGAGAGTLATILFARIFAVVYLPEKHPIKLMTYISGMDMIRLGVIIGVAIIVCFMIIRRIIKGLKITEALKLGED